MKIYSILIASLLLYNASSANAEYYLYFMNNTHKNLRLENTCDRKLSKSYCTALNSDKIDAFKRVESHVVDYDKGILHMHNYTQNTYFSMPGGGKAMSNNYFATTFHGDLVGSHITEISVYIDGNKHVLLNSNNDSHKVLPDKVGSVDIKHSDGNTYTFYVDAQADQLTVQGIDSIYFAINQKPIIYTSEKENELTVITYNIKAFPDIVGAKVDLNKMDSRVKYLSQTDYLRHADVVVFEEAWSDSAREVLKKGLHDVYPHSYDPDPKHSSLERFVKSGLLILSRYPITQSSFLNYQDYQTMVDEEILANKGAAYFKIDKNGKAHNFIATHTQSGNSNKEIAIREEEFILIKQLIIENTDHPIAHHESLMFLGDTNCNFYKKSQFPFMKATLNLNDEGVLNNDFKTPKYSSDSALNLMTHTADHEVGLYDMVLPVKGFLQPKESRSQITPLRALDDNRMYQRSYDANVYNYGNVELSDHFMVQAKFTFDE